MREGREPQAGELAWVQPRPRRLAYRLEKDGQEVGALEWAEGSPSLATGIAGGSRWTLRDVGISWTRISVRMEGAETDVAVFHAGLFSGGILRFSDGRTYRWKRVSAWRSEWAFLREDGTSVVRFRERMTVRGPGTVRIEEPDLPARDLSILLILGWYLLVRLDRADSGTGGLASGTPTP